MCTLLFVYEFRNVWTVGAITRILQDPNYSQHLLTQFSPAIPMFINTKLVTFCLAICVPVFVAACRQGEVEGASATHSPEIKTSSFVAANSVQSGELVSGRVVANKGFDTMQIKGKLDTSGQVVLIAGDSSISIRALKCMEETETLQHCIGEVELLVQAGGRPAQRIVLSSFFFDSAASLYRGPLHSGVVLHRHSLILSDVNNDGVEDLLVWTGKEGAYGGPSFDVYLMRTTGQFELSEEYSELTVGYNGLFAVDGNLIKTVASSGCCMHVFETYEIRQNEEALVLIERVTEDNTDPAKPLKIKEALVGGVLKKIM